MIANTIRDGIRVSQRKAMKNVHIFEVIDDSMTIHAQRRLLCCAILRLTVGLWEQKEQRVTIRAKAKD